MRMLSVALVVSLAACATEEPEERLPTQEEVQAVRDGNASKFLADNTEDGVFHVPNPPSVQDETSYSSCSHQWEEYWYFAGIPAGTQYHVSRCNNGVGEYCTWIDVWAACFIDPVDCLETLFIPTCTPTACACVEPGPGGGGDCGCSGMCGSTCCI